MRRSGPVLQCRGYRPLLLHTCRLPITVMVRIKKEPARCRLLFLLDTNR